QMLRNDIAKAAASIAPAGALNSLSQALLRMTAPGVPDLYQGCEFWDFSLVDPDNRRPIDFGARVAALSADEAVTTSAKADPNQGEELVKHWQDGHIKQWLVAKTLNARGQYPSLFTEGNYQALQVEGDGADQIIAFARQHGSKYLVVIAPRLCANLLGDSAIPLVSPSAWGDTRVKLPGALHTATTLVDSFSSFNFSPLKSSPIKHSPIKHSSPDHIQLKDSVLVSELLAHSPVNFFIFDTINSSVSNSSSKYSPASSTPASPHTPTPYGEVSHEH
ncbi:MAG: hypothetical protein ABW044_03425, partial [Cellvibrio sp.]